ncbi:molybdopterin cofactor-binding domain-containing protein [Antarcticibacterium sp. 1MA-6-2]|uniref:molybdopterin cofactor-binding domain-containing protein n=1 Tax=Antarcticibacterium sp. 1MA-6-2 TaxID=2908210 RepID=UPI0021033D20|nr:molybdopterin cofactor-binding domain-containing protein [Antarcticibacterium sp. 1MA-6-2]
MKTGRRDFIKQMGCVSIGFSILGPQALMGGRAEADCEMNPFLEDSVNAWLQVLEDGRVRVLTGKMELGQGIRIAVAQVAAEELNMDPHLVEVNLAETGVTANEGYTSWSRSIESSAMSIRKAAATAREILLEMAAKKLNSDASTLKLENGLVTDGSRNLNFFEILEGRQLEETLREPKEFYCKTKRRVVGKPIPRTDIAAMVRGEMEYVQDLKFPDMVHARIIRPSSYTSTLSALDETGLEQMPGFLKLVKIGSFVGVIVEEEYQALKISWEVNNRAKWKSEEFLPDTPLKDHLKNLPADTETDENTGNWEQSVKGAVVQHKASYFKPYLMHGANGPSCAVAHYNNNKLDVYTHSQGVYPLRDTLANLLEMEGESIHVKGVPGSGCYGHNAADDVAAEAALLAVEFPGRHVRLQWMRDEEHRWEPYGTAMIMGVQAGVDA